VDLIVKESDNNVKLIVLDRFDVLRAKHEHVLDGYVLDILKVLSSPDMEVKRKAIGVALEMVTSRNVEEVVLFLKKQLQNTLEQDFDKVGLRVGIGSLKSWLITLLHPPTEP
jgi:coatomer subunit beta